MTEIKKRKKWRECREYGSHKADWAYKNTERHCSLTHALGRIVRFDTCANCPVPAREAKAKLASTLRGMLRRCCSPGELMEAANFFTTRYDELEAEDNG